MQTASQARVQAVPVRRARGGPARPRPRLAAVPPRARSDPSIRARRTPRLRRVPFLLFSLLVVAAMVAALASAQALVVQGSFRLSELSRRAEQLELESDLLRLRMARLASPARLTAAARREGLVRPQRVEVLARGAADG